MLKDIYMLLPQDVIDFNALNALPENNQGPVVTPMSYTNMNYVTSVKMNFEGTPFVIIPPGLRFTENPSMHVWDVTSSLHFNAEGECHNVYAECRVQGKITAAPNTLTKLIDTESNITSLTNPNSAIESCELFEPCVDKSTIDNPIYQPWADAMENNQAISTRQVITITVM